MFQEIIFDQDYVINKKMKGIINDALITRSKRIVFFLHTVEVKKILTYQIAEIMTPT